MNCTFTRMSGLSLLNSAAILSISSGQSGAHINAVMVVGAGAVVFEAAWSCWLQPYNDMRMTLTKAYSREASSIRRTLGLLFGCGMERPGFSRHLVRT